MTKGLLYFTALVISFSAIVYSQELSYAEIQDSYKNSYIYESIEDYNNAINALYPVFNAYPNTYTVNLRMGWLYYLNGHYANSIDYYKKAVKILPASIEAKLGYVMPLLAQQKYSEVESICYQVIKTDYYNYFGNLRLAYALRMDKKFELAEKVAIKMLVIYPTDVSFLGELALVKLAQEDTDYAFRLFNDILALDSENMIAKQYLLKATNND